MFMPRRCFEPAKIVRMATMWSITVRSIPAIGTEDDFQSFARQLRQEGLGLMLDVVPNHMGIDDPHNGWWQDVLENGPSSPYATFFDIDWSPPKESLKDKVFLPFLGDQYGTVLESRELQLAYDGDRFSIVYFDRQFPVGPIFLAHDSAMRAGEGGTAARRRPRRADGIGKHYDRAGEPTATDGTGCDAHPAAAAGKGGHPSPIGGPLFDSRADPRGPGPGDRRFQRDNAATRTVSIAWKHCSPSRPIGFVIGGSLPTRSTIAVSSTSMPWPPFVLRTPRSFRPCMR